jgi:hypothetical protein
MRASEKSTARMLLRGGPLKLGLVVKVGKGTYKLAAPLARAA